MKRREFVTLIGGAAAAWPLAARAQQNERMQRIGFLSGCRNADPEIQSWARGFVQRLEELGWVNGRNLRIDTRFGDTDATRLSRLATELVELGPHVILASGGHPPAIAVRQHTLSIPILFVQVADPVSAGFVTNLARPEGNITGFTNFVRSEESGCNSLRNVRQVLTELRWFLIQPIQHGLLFCGRSRRRHHHSAYG